MPAALPLVEDTPGAPPSLWSIGGGAQAAVGGAEVGGSGNVGMNSPEAADSAHLWMAGVMVFALVALIGLHVSGFRFATDVGVTRG